MFGASHDPLHQLVFERGLRAIKSADVIIFVVDGREGLAHGDEDIATAVRAANVPVLLAVNKTDDRRARAGALELYQLGFDPVFEVSAEHGHGVGELLDEVVRRLPGTARARQRDVDEDGGPEHDAVPSDSAATPEQPEVAVAIVGRPNAGKSSLVNRLLREERMIVSD